jgi:glycosyltransferase involved in cell wall biosynthesis
MNFCDSDVVFIFSGRLLNYKGIVDLIESFEHAAKEDSRAKLIIAGEGPERGSVEDHASQKKGILYAGRVEFDRLIEMYHASDVLVLPSHFEPWGLVVNEAMAASLPVIVSSSVGCSDDLVKQGETGFIVEQGDIDALKNTMLSCVQDGNKRKIMGKRAQELISRWTIEEEARIIVEAWQGSQS